MGRRHILGVNRDYWSMIAGYGAAYLEDVLEQGKITRDTMPPGVLRETRALLSLQANPSLSPFLSLLEKFEPEYAISDDERPMIRDLQRHFFETQKLYESPSQRRLAQIGGSQGSEIYRRS